MTNNSDSNRNTFIALVTDIIDRRGEPQRHFVLAMVTGGTGASTGFACDEELVALVLD